MFTWRLYTNNGIYYFKYLINNVYLSLFYQFQMYTE